MPIDEMLQSLTQSYPIEAELYPYLDETAGILNALVTIFSGEPEDGSMALIGGLQGQTTPLPREFFDRLSDYYLDPNIWDDWQIDRAKKILDKTPVGLMHV